ncbi:mechanosensitive ion channel family protein, partial [Vibrio fluvialis]|nr:mechanosensitive ion channel family protein [Vibrio fluvialis]
MEHIAGFYDTHQALIMQILQNALLTIFIFILASVVSKLVKRGVFKATEKVSGGDEIIARLLSQVASYAV